MGCNFYLAPKPACEHCGRAYESLHIGKSSAGWCFSLHVDPDNGIHDLDDWVRLWSEPGATITDEYGESVTTDAMLKIITERGRLQAAERKPYGYESWEQFHRQNYSEPGPSGLLRHQIDGRHCIKHGAGTWDCITGEFS